MQTVCYGDNLQFAWTIKPNFLGKIEKKYFNVSSAEIFLPSMQGVKALDNISHIKFIRSVYHLINRSLNQSYYSNFPLDFQGKLVNRNKMGTTAY